jgi:putative CocE/NonD family hydrolase
MATSDALITISPLPRPVRAIENVWIPMRDGARLAARIWLPENADAEPVPALLEYIPYRKRDFTRHRDSIMHPYVAANGYACVRVDLRGSGDSDGVLTDEYTQQELDDGCDVIAWLAAQPWCSGRVGMIGIRGAASTACRSQHCAHRHSAPSSACARRMTAMPTTFITWAAACWATISRGRR